MWIPSLLVLIFEIITVILLMNLMVGLPLFSFQRFVTRFGFHIIPDCNMFHASAIVMNIDRERFSVVIFFIKKINYSEFTDLNSNIPDLTRRRRCRETAQLIAGQDTENQGEIFS